MNAQDAADEVEHSQEGTSVRKVRKCRSGKDCLGGTDSVSCGQCGVRYEACAMHGAIFAARRALKSHKGLYHPSHPTPAATTGEGL